LSRTSILIVGEEEGVLFVAERRRDFDRAFLQAGD
jgi:hypothetical protein